MQSIYGRTTQPKGAQRMCDAKDGWTVETLKESFSALREADQRLYDERDRRYTSEAELRAMALRIKETADAEALRLAREAQSLKDQQTEQLRDESLSKSGVYVTKDALGRTMDELKSSIESALKPLTDFMSKQQGAAIANTKSNAKIFAVIGLIVAVFNGSMIAAMKALGI